MAYVCVDLIASDGELAAAAMVDPGLWQWQQPYLQYVAGQRGFSAQQGYADTDHPTMVVSNTASWDYFVGITPDPSAPGY